VAVRLQRAHAKFFGQCQGFPVMGFRFLGMILSCIVRGASPASSGKYVLSRSTTGK
jgi:hypothetical protein